MEEKKKKRQEEKTKNDAAPNKAADQKTKVPEPAPKPSPGPPHPHPASPSVHPPSSSSASGANGKRAPAVAPTPQPACQPSASPRYPPREVPPRFRQQEHKQLLKRGQPLPAALTLASFAAPASPAAVSPGASSSNSTFSGLIPLAAGKRHTDGSPQSGAQYESPSWAADSLIIDGSDPEAWPSISRGGDGRPTECPSASPNCHSTPSPATSSSTSVSMATGATGQQAHYPAPAALKATANMMTGPSGASRGWGSDPKQDGPPMNGTGRGGAPNSWGAPNFNLNLNPSANPSAWPVLGQDGPGGMGPPGSGCMANPNGSMGNGGDSGGWGGMMSPDSDSQPSSNMSFSMEAPKLNTDGLGHGKQQPEPMSPIHGLPGWGGQSPTESSQLNGDPVCSSVWGSGDTKSNDSSAKDSGWDSSPAGGHSAWGRQGSGGGNGNGGWGDWGKPPGGGGGGESKSWDSAATSSGQDQPMCSWGQQPGTAPASEGSGEGSEGRSRHRDRSSDENAPPPLPRQDLDPRVLCNTGWGQTPVRQHTSWEMEEASKNEAGPNGWGSSNGPASPSPPPPPANGSTGNPGQRPSSGGKSDGGWGAPPPQPAQTGSGWGNQPSVTKTPNGANSGGWGEPMSCGPNTNGPKNGGSQSWGSEEKCPTWEDAPAKNHQQQQQQQQQQPQGWGEGPKSSRTWGNDSGGSNGSSGEWGEPEVKKNNNSSSMWDGEEGEGGGGGWKETPRGGNGGTGGSWGKTAPAMGGGGWGESAPQRPNGPAQGWGSKPQDSSSGSSSGSGSGGGGGGVPMGSWGGPGSVKQSSNWSGSKAEPGMEPTGWEEPSPPSIRRKMEIDDGTSSWGDPGTYNKTVNMWDKNNPTGHPGNSQPPPPPPAPANKNGGMMGNSNQHAVGPGNNNNNSSHHHHHHLQHHHPHHGQPPTHPQHHGGGHHNNNNGSPNSAAPHQGGGPQGRPPLANPGWGELPSVQSKSEPAWGEPAGPSPAVDNGTAAWGKPSGGVGTWNDGGHEPSGPYGRGNAPPGPAPCKPASKSMQDGWGGEDMMSSSQWDADDGGDMWSSPTSQDSSSPCNSWGNGPKKGPPKGKMSNKPDDSWIMNRLVKQLTDMGFPRDPAEEALKSNNMNLDQAMSALLEKKSELDKRGMGLSDYNNGMNKPMVCRPSALSKDSERSHYLDKDGLSDDVPNSPFLPSPGLKLPLASSSNLPGQGLGQGSPGQAMQNLNNRQMQSGMFGSSGAAQSRAMQQQQHPPPQPSVPPLSSSQPSLRAQVPHLLSPQVQAQLLQFAAKNIGLNPALLTSPINPQQMTLLYQLQQLQMAYQRLQIQQQMMQAQRNVSGPVRQQEQQVARTINNMQQQIQQHQRQLYQALLMKQQPPSHPSSSSGLHPNAGPGKSALDPYPGPQQAPGLPDLHTKETQSSPSSYHHYPLSGLNPNMNVNCMEVGGLSLKEPPQPQSRLSQWTHPNSMDSLSGSSSHMEANLNKHGAISAASNLGPPGKPPLDDSYSPYNLMASAESPTSPLVAPDSWGPGPGKSPNDKISNGTNINWPPEFCPGVPWKGLQNIDPENDPNMTPGSVHSGPTINTNIQDVNRYLLRDRSGGKMSDIKSTWSPGPIAHSQVSLSHELWKVPQGPRNSSTAPSRPPPGLTHNKAPASSTWGGNQLGLAHGWSSSYTSEGTTWSTDSSNRTSSWLVLRNLTPQIDGSTLRTLCMQHGPLITFHLNLTQGNAVVRYSSKEEAAKAQKSLHMCVLGNTTILAEFAGEEEVTRFFAQGQSLPPTTSWQANQGTNQIRMGGASQSHPHPIGHWSSGGGGGSSMGGVAKSSGDLLWGGVPQYSSLWGPPSGEDARVIGSPTPINTLLPGDLLSGESM